mmetsp:Transcript_810/g.1774  ORF Transcript_810/g.1774 Transcript_810/m.1774 type:complete len:152 (+) Transcript_810:49-504(+)
MDSSHFQKNPWLRQVYWAEVCKREVKPHLFARSRAFAPRSFPTSTMKAHFGACEDLGVIVEKRPPGVPLAIVSQDLRPSTVGAASQRTGTPRVETTSRPSTTGISSRSQVNTIDRVAGATLPELMRSRHPLLEVSLRSARLTPSQRPPAGA